MRRSNPGRSTIKISCWSHISFLRSFVLNIVSLLSLPWCKEINKENYSPISYFILVFMNAKHLKTNPKIAHAVYYFSFLCSRISFVDFLTYSCLFLVFVNTSISARFVVPAPHIAFFSLCILFFMTRLFCKKCENEIHERAQ